MAIIKDAVDGDVLLDEKIEHKIRRPSMFKVVLLNDDYTPMDFVIDVLSKYFNMNSDKATEIMLTIHYEGKGVCGVFSNEVAETKVDQVCRYARINEHPLMCTMEPA